MDRQERWERAWQGRESEGVRGSGRSKQQEVHRLRVQVRLRAWGCVAALLAGNGQGWWVVSPMLRCGAAAG